MHLLTKQEKKAAGIPQYIELVVVAEAPGGVYVQDYWHFRGNGGLVRLGRNSYGGAEPFFLTREQEA